VGSQQALVGFEELDAMLGTFSDPVWGRTGETTDQRVRILSVTKIRKEGS
jgi:hypothetical protein